jgi:hypothetical protein
MVAALNSRLRVRLLGPGALVALALAAGCAHRQSSGERARTARPPGALVATAADRWGGSACPTMVPGVSVVVTDIENGSALTLTTRQGDVEELRRRALNLAAAYNAAFDNWGPSVRQRYVESPRSLGGGGTSGYGVRGGEGSKTVVVPGRPPSRAVVEVVPHGARVSFSTESPLEVRYLRARVARQAVQMWAGACPEVG